MPLLLPLNLAASAFIGPTCWTLSIKNNDFVMKITWNIFLLLFELRTMSASGFRCFLIVYFLITNFLSREILVMDTETPAFIPKSENNSKCCMWGRKGWRHGWMWSLLICLTHSVFKWEWMEGFPMSWLEDGWVCGYGFNWLKTGIQLGIIESWKSLKAQVHEIIRRANQVVINSWHKLSARSRRKGARYPAIFKVAWRWC